MNKKLKITGLSTTEKSIEELNIYLLKKISKVEKENTKLKERKEKLEKAWEICKKKKVCLLGVSSFKNVKDYNDLCNHIFENKSRIKYDQLTETEFNLLKEMLEEK